MSWQLGRCVAFGAGDAIGAYLSRPNRSNRSAFCASALWSRPALNGVGLRGFRAPQAWPTSLPPSATWPRRVGYPTIAFAIIAFKVSRSKAHRGIDRVPALGWLYSELACLSFEEFPMDRMATEILRFAPRGE